MKRGWGYGRCSHSSISEILQRNKSLINTTEVGTKIYKSFIGLGVLKNEVIWHDNRATKFPSMLIVKTTFKNKSFNIYELKTQKEIFNFAENKLNELSKSSS